MSPDDDSAARSAVARALVAPPQEAELAGEQLARQAFRREFARQRARRRGIRVLSGTGATVAASSLVLSMTVVTAAAYTPVMPHGVRHAAHRLLHHIGLPAPDEDRTRVTQERPAATRPDRERSPAPQRPAPALRSHVVEPCVHEGGDARVLVVVSDLSGQVAGGGAATLFAKTPGATRWVRAGRAAVDRHGTATLTLRHVPHDLLLRWVVSGLPGAQVVLSPVTTQHACPAIRVAPRPSTAPVGSQATLTVVSSSTQRGRPVTLQELLDGRWQSLRRAVLDGQGEATFLLGSPERRTLRLRCVLGRSALYAAASTKMITLTFT